MEQNAQEWSYIILRNNGKITYNGSQLNTAHNVLYQDQRKNQKYTLLMVGVDGKSVFVSYNGNVAKVKENDEENEKCVEKNIVRQRLTLYQFKFLGEFPQRVSGDIGVASRAYKHSLSDRVQE
ncbi:MAG: hypothetical protein ABIH25_03470 [Candidatus Woesearchaeota archaeon]